jgi:hypothetical protein
MAYKVLAAAQVRWRCVNAPHQVALVRAGATFVDGFIVEREKPTGRRVISRPSTTLDNISVVHR